MKLDLSPSSNAWEGALSKVKTILVLAPSSTVALWTVGSAITVLILLVITLSLSCSILSPV